MTMVSKICFLKNYYGGDCLHSAQSTASTKVQPDSEPDKNKFPDVMPDMLNFDITIPYYQRHIPEGSPRVTREPTAKEVAFFESTEPVKAIGPETDYLVIDEKINRDGTTRVVNQSKYNEVAHGYNKVKSMPVKANAALAALDAANFYYEHRDEIDNVADFAQMYGSEIVEGVKETAETVVDAALKGDIPTLAVTGASLVGIPVVTRTIDNVADLAGIEGVNTTGAVMDATAAASEYVSDIVQDSRGGNPFVVPSIGGVISSIIKRWF